MLTIRKEQKDTLAAAMRPGFIEQLTAHMREHFPGRCEILGETQLQETVALGVERAAHHGFLAEREVFLYLSLMFLLGSYLDIDVQLPWVSTLLATDRYPDAYTRVVALYEEAMDYLDQTAGENEEEQHQVLVRLTRLDLDQASQRLRGRFSRGVVAVLRDIHPKKVALLGSGARKKLLNTGSKAAIGHGFTGEKARMLYLLQMFIFGSSFDQDPQFPWAQDALNHPASLSENDRVDLLHAGCIGHLNQLLALTESGI